MYELYDIHAHLADARIAGEAERILDDSRAHGLRGVLVNAARLREWPLVAELATQPGVCGALGLHPFFLAEWGDGVPDRLRAALMAGRIPNNAAVHPAFPGDAAGSTPNHGLRYRVTSNDVPAPAAPPPPDCGLRAVGEIGLDLWQCKDRTATLNRQLPVFEAQLAVACELGLPAILHNRKAWPEFFAVWKRVAAGKIDGVCHHFTGTPEILREALDLGLHVSFCGPITYENSRRIHDVAKVAPLDRILTETDTPDLPAVPWHGLRSEPWHVSAIITELARLKCVSEEEIANAVTTNYRRILQLPQTPKQ